MPIYMYIHIYRMAVRKIVLRNSSIYDYYHFDLLINLLSLKARSEVKYDIFKSLYGVFI